jgi:hypothetical protein
MIRWHLFHDALKERFIVTLIFSLFPGRKAAQLPMITNEQEKSGTMDDGPNDI